MTKRLWQTVALVLFYLVSSATSLYQPSAYSFRKIISLNKRYAAIKSNDILPSKGKNGFQRPTKVVDSKRKGKKPSLIERSWKSGSIFLDKDTAGRRRRSQEPWWMREDESRNPDLLPRYEPWWLTKNIDVDSSWSYCDLVEEARRRSLSTEGSSLELVERINDSFREYSLRDSNFKEPWIVETALPPASCFPEVYERLRDCEATGIS